MQVKDGSHFLKVVSQETERIKKLSDKFEAVLNDTNLPEDGGCTRNYMISFLMPTVVLHLNTKGHHTIKMIKLRFFNL